jgi:hypothetical protein
MFAIRSFISIIDDHSLTPCSPVVAYRFTYHAQPVVVDNSRNYRRFGAGHQQRLEKSNRTCGGLPGQSPCGTIQAHRVCKRPVPKPRGFPSRAGLRLDSIASVESRERLAVDRRMERASLKPNRAHGGETPVSPVVYSARLIYVSSLSGAFGKRTATFVSYSTRQHRCPPPDIPLRLANYVKNASPDVIHLLMRDKPPSLLVQGQ